MLFNSVIFITVFLPIALVGWYLLQKMENPFWAKAFIVGMSLWFYGYYNINYLWILLGSLCFNYLLSFLFERVKQGMWRKGLFYVGIFGNVGLLFYYKYFNFFIDNCNFFLHTDVTIEKIALPLGISFFTFQQLSFVVERYRENAPHYTVEDYCFFVAFFPQLVAGPIVLHSELIPQLQERNNRYFSLEKFYDGLTLFILGFAKKVLLADTFAILVNAEYANIPALDSPSAWVVICWYMMELYFDFSGYCDMARGIGKMFGFWLPENFDSPFKATSVKDYWRRWHMTLTRFLTQYVYIPLGGSRKGKRRQAFNLFVVFAVSGIWHGANWTYVVWGLLQGLAISFETLFPKARFKWEWLNRLCTLVYVTLSVSIFRSESLTMAIELWKKLFAGGVNGIFVGMCNLLQYPENYALIKLSELVAPQYLNLIFVATFLLLTLIGLILLSGKKAEQWIEKYAHTIPGTICLATLFVWSFISLSQVSVFLYFNF